MPPRVARCCSGLMTMRSRLPSTARPLFETSRSFKPEIVFLDIGLPGLNGLEVAKRLRQSPEGAGVMLVALSGYGQPEDRRRSLEAGFDRHLVKPVNHEQLDAAIAAYDNKGGRAGIGQPQP